MANDINDSNQSNDEDNFGLPDIEYKPLDQLEQKTEQQETVNTESEQQEYTSTNEEEAEKTYEPRKYSDATRSYEEEEKSNAPVVIGIIVALVVIVGAFLVWQFVYQPRKKAQEELAAKAAAAKKAEAERVAKEKEEAERKKREAEAAVANAKPAEGTIETLSTRTGRYYVIVSSAVDGDLVMDNAKKMSAKGVSTKIIPPFGKWKFYRLAIADFDSFAGAQSNADASKGEYGPATWVMRY